jgi:hypothetical protein
MGREERHSHRVHGRLWHRAHLRQSDGGMMMLRRRRRRRRRKKKEKAVVYSRAR